MKCLVILVALVAVASAQFNNFGKPNAFRAPAGVAARASAFVSSVPARVAAVPARTVAAKVVAVPARAAQAFAAAPRPQAFAAAPRPQAAVAAAAAAPRPQAPVAVASRASSGDQSANIVRYESDASPDGAFSYSYETDNGIAGQAEGSPRDFPGNPPAVGEVIQGSYSWTSPEGQKVIVTYVADENGYQPSGDVIPTPHPIPPLIQKSLEYLARNAKPQ